MLRDTFRTECRDGSRVVKHLLQRPKPGNFSDSVYQCSEFDWFLAFRAFFWLDVALVLQLCLLQLPFPLFQSKQIRLPFRSFPVAVQDVLQKNTLLCHCFCFDNTGFLGKIFLNKGSWILAYNDKQGWYFNFLHSNEKVFQIKGLSSSRSSIIATPLLDAHVQRTTLSAARVFVQFFPFWFFNWCRCSRALSREAKLAHHCVCMLPTTGLKPRRTVHATVMPLFKTNQKSKSLRNKILFPL